MIRMKLKHLIRFSSFQYVIVISCAWSVLMVFDYGMRFFWYKWHRSFIHTSVKVSSAPVTPMSVRQGQSTKGGNLSHMIGIDFVAERFEESRPAFVEYTDEFGYPNPPPVTNTWYPIVVTGDSFMVVPDNMEQRMDAQLKILSQTNVYNHSVKGRGPFYGMVYFLASEYFIKHPPRYLIYGLTESDISGNLYVSLLSRVHYHLNELSTETVSKNTSKIWKRYRVERLSESLTQSSALAQLSQKIWNRVRYFLFNTVTSDIIIADGQVEGREILFYSPNINAMKWSRDIRDIPKVTWVLSEIDEMCKDRDINLVIVLIPDKEQVYRKLIPETLQLNGPIPASCLWALENSLKVSGIHVVNLLDPFREKSRQGELLYWADDTHWNPKGIRLAAECIWSSISNQMSEVNSKP